MSGQDRLDLACEEAAVALATPGDWLDASERLTVWAQAREAQTNELDQQRRQALSPAAVTGRHLEIGALSSQANELVHRVASDPGRLTKQWALECMQHLDHGERSYTEIVGVTAISRVIDRFDSATGLEPRTIPTAAPGEPARAIPGGVGDVGAWVSQSLDKARANVSRTLSLVPVTNAAWRRLVDEMYSRGAEFFDLAWRRPLSRPQTELVAARTTVLNQCFY